MSGTDRQLHLMQEMNTLLINFKKDGPERKSPERVYKKIEQLEGLWNEFQTNHMTLISWEDKSHAYFQENKYLLTSNFYRSTMDHFLTWLPQETKAPTPIIKPARLNVDHGGESSQQGRATPPIQQQSNDHQTHAENESTSNKVTEMIRKQSSNYKAFQRTVNAIDINNMSIKWEFEDALKSLQARWTAIDTLHWEIDSYSDSKDLYREMQFTTWELQFNNTKKRINNKMWSLTHQEKSTPKMEIPTFSGSYQQWTTFKDLFFEVIHYNASLSDAQKMQFLKGKVKGEAEKLIQHLNISSSNYLTCWEILQNRYENKKLIFTSHINSILNLPTIQHPSATSIKKMHDTVNECIYAINNLGVDTTSWSPLLVHLLSQKLDADTHNDYLEQLKNPRELPELQEFLAYLEHKFTSLEASRRRQDVPKTTSSQHSEPSTSFKKAHTYKAFSTKQNENTKQPGTISSNKQLCTKLNSNYNKCVFCKGEHQKFACKAFLELQPDARRTEVAKHNLCPNCLFEHKLEECRSDKRCRVCDKNHNTLLHDAFTNLSKKEQYTKNNSHVSQDELSETLLSTALIRVQAADNTLVTLRALIDQGSQVSLITERAVQQLKLPRGRCKGIVYGVGAKESTCKGVINVTCTARHSDYSFNTDVFIMRNLINNLPNNSFQKPQWPFLENIELADPEFHLSRPVDLLLGADIYSNIIQEGIIRHTKSQPVAQQTRLGWILCGHVQAFHCNVLLNNVEDIQQFWSVEDIAENSDMSLEDLQCLQHYKDTTSRNQDGRYVTKYPFVEDLNEKLGASKPMAAAQFRNLERKFSRQEKLAKAYRAFIEEYQSLNHMVECTSGSTYTLSCYLPHHGVERADSTTTALRVVFNASARTSSGYTLNDLMKRGPNLQQDLMSLILRWRQYQFAFTADIEKMFRQILISDDHQCLQKILWRSYPNQVLREYQMTTVTYGTKAAPFIAMMTLKQLAADEGHKFPHSRAATALQEEFYMDDLISGSFSIESAKQLQSDLIKLLQSGGFNLRKWSSNKTELLQDSIPADNNEAFSFKMSESTKTLGLQWNPEKDVFTFQLKISATSETHTKRSLLSDISKIFDPLGWLSPVTTKLKLLFQQIWLLNIQWDQELPVNLTHEWEKIRADLHQHFHRFQLQRWYQCGEGDCIEILGFSDSSIKTYACVVYGKCNGKITLIAAKTRLVPANKNLTLPRLELCGAHLLTKLVTKILQALTGHHLKVFAWTDSTAVLGWIQGDINRWKPFVANRVKQIKDVIPPDNWRYVKSSENPADCASRGISAEQLLQHPLWWQGPPLLATFNEQEQSDRPKFTSELEVKITKQSNAATLQCTDDIIQRIINKHSNLMRAVRVLAWVRRVLSLRQSDRVPYLSVHELNEAKYMIVKYVQRTEFSDEIDNIQQNKPLHNKSKILNLNPFLDEYGILRVGGRIKHANINSEMKHPMIIPHSSHLTNLIIDQAHQSTFHGGPRLTASFIRQSYWILGGNRAVKKRLLPCVVCKRHTHSKHNQLMGDLPEPRTNPTRPFYHTGVDYTGYVDVKMNKGRGAKTTKGYIAVFVCMSTKAVHLELVSDMSSSAFLAALKRMSSRRGKPGHLYSDNGTNFVGANRELQHQFIQQTQNSQFQDTLSDLCIEWHFNAPAWPSAGGLWEAAVKSLKHHLRRVVGAQKLTFEEYATLLAQLEACLNGRPLCAMTEDPDDLDYLTPSHFLSSGPTLTILQTDEDERTRWQRVRKIYEDIWKRWQVEYLSQLSARSKWKQPKTNIKLNDVVLIHEDNIPAGKWLLGRVTELHPGSDSYVRVVSLKTKNGHLKRPIVKLTPILTSHEKSTAPDEKQSDVKQSQGRYRRSIANIVSSILSFIFFMTLAAAAHSSPSITNLSKAIYFDKISTIRFVQDEWKLIAYYDMNPYWDGVNTFDKYLKHIGGVCDKMERVTLCDIVLIQLNHKYDELKHYNQMLLDQRTEDRPRPRMKRGLVDGVGYLANTLFGVLDERFATQYQKDISLIRENQNHLALLWKNQTSVLEAQYNLLQRTEDTINKQHKIINQHLNYLSKATNTLNKEVRNVEIINELSISSFIANNMITELRYIQDMLLDTLTDIHHEMFNIHLIPPEQLRHELNVISGQLQQNLALPINNTQSELAHIYHLLKVRARLTKQFLIFEIKIPLVSRDSYELYQLIPIAQQVKNTSISVIPISDHVAINLHARSYIPMSQVGIQKCSEYGENTRLCYSHKPIYQFQTDDSLCSKDHVTNKCRIITTACIDTWTELSYTNSYLFYCCGHCTLKTICDENQMTALKKRQFTYQSEKTVTSKDTISQCIHTSTKTHANLYTPGVPPINSILNISVPMPTIEVPSGQNTTHQLDAIKEQINQMKTETPLLTGEASSHDIHQYITMYVTLAGCAVAAAVALWRRVRRARHQVLAITGLSQEPPPLPAPRALYAVPRRPRATLPQTPRRQRSQSEYELRDFVFHEA